MKSLFTLLAIFSVTIILSIGGASYWQMTEALKELRQQTAQANAEGIATNLSSQVILLQNLVSKLAQSPGVVAAFSSNDQIKMQQTSQQLEQYIPGAKDIRLIPANAQETNSNSLIGIGYADLELVRESFIAQQPVAIHETGANQHLAIASKTVKDNVAIGVLIVSINTDSITASIKNANLMNNYVRLMQGELLILARGDASFSQSTEQVIQIPNTNWLIFYRSSESYIDKFIGWSIAIPLLGILFILFGLRTFEMMLIKDRNIILNAIKDLSVRKWQDHYAAQFTEMRFMISTMADINQKLYKPISIVSSSDNQAKISDNDNPLEARNDDLENLTISEAEQSLKKVNHPLNGFTGSNLTKLIFQEFEVGGIVDKSLNKDIFYALGKGFGSEAALAKIEKITVAYDGRLSSQGYAESFAKGVIASGVDVIDIGLAPAPLHYFALLKAPGQSGALISGSNMPSNFNSLKLFLLGDPISPSKLLTIKQRIDCDDYLAGTSGNIEKISRFTNDYLNSISTDIHINQPIKIVIDCGNASPCVLAPKIFKNLGCEVIELFCEINGNFPNHHPDPSKSENLSDLIAAVQYYEAAIGIAFDGDGGRLGIVDSHGRIIEPEKVFTLFAQNILQIKPSATILYDDRGPKNLEQIIQHHGGKLVLVKNQSLIIQQKLKDADAILAGNNEGNIYFKDRWMGISDALYAAARLIEIIAADSRDSSLIFNCLDQSKEAKHTIEFTPK